MVLFPGSALAHQAQDLAFADLELDVAQHSRLVRIIDREASFEQLVHRWLTNAAAHRQALGIPIDLRPQRGRR